MLYEKIAVSSSPSASRASGSPPRGRPSCPTARPHRRPRVRARARRARATGGWRRCRPRRRAARRRRRARCTGRGTRRSGWGGRARTRGSPGSRSARAPRRPTPTTPGRPCASGRPNSSMPPTPRAWASAAISAATSAEMWRWPGSEAIGRSTPEPVTTKSGWTRSAGETRVSRTRLRRPSVRRRRRMRTAGKLTTGSLDAARMGPRRARIPITGWDHHPDAAVLLPLCPTPRSPPQAPLDPGPTEPPCLWWSRGRSGGDRSRF